MTQSHDEVRERLERFDRGTERQRARQAHREPAEPGTERGWTREDLYDRAALREEEMPPKSRS